MPNTVLISIFTSLVVSLITFILDYIFYKKVNKWKKRQWEF